MKGHTMSVGYSSDLATDQGGLEPEANGSTPVPGSETVPMEDADAALTDQDFASEPASEGEEVLDLGDWDIEFLNSDAARQYLRDNPPEGMFTQEQVQQHVANVQSVKDREVAQAKQQATQAQTELRQLQDSLSEREGQLEQVINALYSAWREAGVDEDEWQQREQQVMQGIQHSVNSRKVSQQQQQQQLNEYTAREFAAINQTLGVMGIDPKATEQVKGLVQDHIRKIHNGGYRTTQEVEAGKLALIQQASQFRQGAQQAQQPAAQNNAAPPQLQGQQQNGQRQGNSRPPGPSRSPRGAGGAGAGRSFAEVFDAGKQQLVRKHGGEDKIPFEELNQLYLNAASQSSS